jgi:hypothetical protein
MPFFVRRPRIMRKPRAPFTSVRIGPVRVRRGGGSISAGPVGAAGDVIEIRSLATADRG